MDIEQKRDHQCKMSSKKYTIVDVLKKLKKKDNFKKLSKKLKYWTVSE